MGQLPFRFGSSWRDRADLHGRGRCRTARDAAATAGAVARRRAPSLGRCRVRPNPASPGRACRPFSRASGSGRFAKRCGAALPARAVQRRARCSLEGRSCARVERIEAAAGGGRAVGTRRPSGLPGTRQPRVRRPRVAGARTRASLAPRRRVGAGVRTSRRRSPARSIRSAAASARRFPQSSTTNFGRFAHLSPRSLILQFLRNSYIQWSADAS